MNFAKILKMDIANGDGIGVSLFTQGCHFHCHGCFNPETWDYDGGEEFTDDTINTIVNLMDKDYISHLSILGGEPLSGCNLFMLAKLITRVQDMYPDKLVYIWTGYTWEELKERRELNGYLNYILDVVDYVITGPFEEGLKDITLQWRGSSNQEIIKLK